MYNAQYDDDIIDIKQSDEDKEDNQEKEYSSYEAYSPVVASVWF